MAPGQGRDSAPVRTTPSSGRANWSTTALADSFARDVSANETVLDGVPTVEVVIAAEVPALGLLGPGVSLRVDGHAVKEVVP